MDEWAIKMFHLCRKVVTPVNIREEEGSDFVRSKAIGKKDFGFRSWGGIFVYIDDSAEAKREVF